MCTWNLPDCYNGFSIARFTSDILVYCCYTLNSKIPWSTFIITDHEKDDLAADTHVVFFPFIAMAISKQSQSLIQNQYHFNSLPGLHCESLVYLIYGSWVVCFCYRVLIKAVYSTHFVNLFIFMHYNGNKENNRVHRSFISRKKYVQTSHFT